MRSRVAANAPDRRLIDAELARRAPEPERLPPPTDAPGGARSPIVLEHLLTRPEGFGLPASPLQRAIVRAADGRPIGGVLTDDERLRYFGCLEDATERPSIVVVVAGVRSGKSILAGASATDSALGADLGQLRIHEMARVAIVAPTVDNAEATYRLLVGHVMGSPALSTLVVGAPTADAIMLRRPDGREVEIVVVAASRGAVTLRSRWLAGLVLDEAALFGEQDAGAAITAEQLLRAAEPRLLKGAQAWVISSPWGPQGLLWELHKAHFGRPGHTLVVHAPTLAMNPAFDAAQVEAIRARDPDTAAREYDAQWLDPERSLLGSADVDRCTRKGGPSVLPFLAGQSYAAAMDAATRGNSWTLVLKTKVGNRHVVVLAQQWTGSKAEPLDPKAVLTEIAAILQRYRVDAVDADAYGTDFLRRVATDCGVVVRQVTMTAEERLDRYQALAVSVRLGELELPPDETLRRDLLSLRKVARQGSVRVELPHTADGRHADYAPSLMLVHGRYVAEAASPLRVFTDEERERQRFDAELARRKQDAELGPAGRVDVMPPWLRGGGQIGSGRRF